MRSPINISLLAPAFLLFSTIFPLSVYAALTARQAGSRCRSQPGDPDFPSSEDWSSFNGSVGGRLLAVVPSAEYCRKTHCTQEQWESENFRMLNSGTMLNVSCAKRIDGKKLSNAYLVPLLVQLGTGMSDQTSYSLKRRLTFGAIS